MIFENNVHDMNQNFYSVSIGMNALNNKLNSGRDVTRKEALINDFPDLIRRVGGYGDVEDVQDMGNGFFGVNSKVKDAGGQPLQIFEYALAKKDNDKVIEKIEESGLKNLFDKFSFPSLSTDFFNTYGFASYAAKRFKCLLCVDEENSLSLQAIDNPQRNQFSDHEVSKVENHLSVEDRLHIMGQLYKQLSPTKLEKIAPTNIADTEFNKIDTKLLPLYPGVIHPDVQLAQYRQIRPAVEKYSELINVNTPHDIKRQMYDLHRIKKIQDWTVDSFWNYILAIREDYGTGMGIITEKSFFSRDNPGPFVEQKRQSSEIPRTEREFDVLQIIYVYDDGNDTHVLTYFIDIDASTILRYDTHFDFFTPDTRLGQNSPTKEIVKKEITRIFGGNKFENFDAYFSAYKIFADVGTKDWQSQGSPDTCVVYVLYLSHLYFLNLLDLQLQTSAENHQKVVEKMKLNPVELTEFFINLLTSKSDTQNRTHLLANQ